MPKMLYPFASRALVHVPKDIFTDKIKECAVECLILGYLKAASGWLFYVPSQWQIFNTNNAVIPKFQELEVKEAQNSPVIKAEVM